MAFIIVLLLLPRLKVLIGAANGSRTCDENQIISATSNLLSFILIVYIYVTDLGDDDEIVFQHNLNQINSFKLLLNHSFIPLHYNIHFFRNIFSQKSARTIERNGKEELDRGRRQSPICHFDSNQQSQPSS